jgi:mono/diheme cytochrome c family protein
MIWRIALLILPLQAGLAMAESVDLTPPASVTAEEGAAAWARIYEVVSHPRCSNCHVGESDRPMWSGPSYGTARPHGMNIRAGDSRIGVEYIPCATCHVNNDVTGSGNAPAHNAPRVAAAWQLAPVEADWFGKDAATICAQLRNPDLNGGRDMTDLAAHLDHDVILHWAWNPGGTREPAPYSLQEHVTDILTWGVAGFPCPQD